MYEEEDEGEFIVEILVDTWATTVHILRSNSTQSIQKWTFHKNLCYNQGTSEANKIWK